MRARHAVVALLMTSAAPVLAQRATGTVRTSGDSAAIGGAAVVVLDSAAREQRRVVTDDQGRYSIQLDASAHTLRVTRLGFAPGMARVAARDTVIDFRLDVNPTQLDTARTTAVVPGDPNLADFERRKRTAPGGRFISDSQLVKLANTPFTSVVRSHFPGVSFITYRGQTLLQSGRGPGSIGAAGYSANPADPRAPRGCWANIYFDGTAIYAGPPATPPDMMAFQTLSFAAIEYYQGGASLPLQFRSAQNDCGTLLLWTRRRPNGR